MPTWSEESKRRAVETRRANTKVDLVGKRYRVRDMDEVPHAGEVVEIVKCIRPGYLWYAKPTEGEQFEVHTHWLNSTCTEIDE